MESSVKKLGRLCDVMEGLRKTSAKVRSALRKPKLRLRTNAVRLARKTRARMRLLLRLEAIGKLTLNVMVLPYGICRAVMIP